MPKITLVAASQPCPDLIPVLLAPLTPMPITKFAPSLGPHRSTPSRHRWLTGAAAGAVWCVAAAASAQVNWHPDYSTSTFHPTSVTSGEAQGGVGPSPAGLSPPGPVGSADRGGGESNFGAARREGAGMMGAGMMASDLEGLAEVDDPAEVIDRRRERLYEELAAEFASLDRLGNLVRRVSQLVQPSVIHIEAHKVEGTGPTAEAFDEAGSGVLVRIDATLWVLTNRHVIHGAQADQIQLRSYDGRTWRAGRILTDDNTDIAVMELLPASERNVIARAGRFDRRPSPGIHLPPARLGDSDRVQIGDFVIAIGSPFGLSHSVTFGILSARGRRDLSLGDQRIELQDFFQTDAAINPGNSGGPLLNLRGEVIGINTAIASSSGGSEGIGFAIPIDMAGHVATELVRHGRLRRGYLGVTLDPSFTTASAADDSRYASMRLSLEGSENPGLAWDEERAAIRRGAKVKDVRAGSPAALARLQKDDVILQFNGVVVDDDDHLVARVGLTPAGQSVPMVVLRDGRRYETHVNLTAMP